MFSRSSFYRRTGRIREKLGGSIRSSIRMIERRNIDFATRTVSGSSLTCRGDSVLFVNVRRLHPLSSSSLAPGFLDLLVLLTCQSPFPRYRRRRHHATRSLHLLADM